MMRTLAILASAGILIVAGAAFGVDEAARDTAGAPSGKVLYHVVSLKFKESATPQQIKEAEEAFAALKTNIPAITSLHWGTNVSPEKRNHGFTHCFVATFASEKDRDAYLVDPAHKAFGKLAGPLFDDVMVIDFWSRD